MLEGALGAFRSGDLATARRLVDDSLARAPGDARSLHLSGEIAARARDLDRALADLSQAARAAGTPDILASLARTQWRRGDGDAAREASARALALAPGYLPAALVAAFVDSARGDTASAGRLLAGAGLRESDPARIEFAFQALADNAREMRRAFAPPARPAAPPLSVTVVVCSVTDAKLARCRAALDAALAPGYEFIAIRDARSLAEAYNRALLRASGEAIVFLHDDVEVVSPGLDALLARALARADVVGIAGTRSLAGPTLGWGGQAPMAGWLVHTDATGGPWDFSLLAFTAGLAGGMEALDGCFLAARAGAARRVGFDEGTFDGFHFYDLDFCFRAKRTGHAVAVDTDILVRHASRGALGPDWQAQAGRFVAKFAPIATAPAQPNHFHAARLENRETALALHDEINGFCAALATREN
ncbi:MAG: glycosyltransferase [Betaproteobacteria bacterium]|nr:glycosyltransferase [Betaproteobacteria bacterium]